MSEKYTLHSPEEHILYYFFRKIQGGSIIEFKELLDSDFHHLHLSEYLKKARMKTIRNNIRFGMSIFISWGFLILISSVMIGGLSWYFVLLIAGIALIPTFGRLIIHAFMTSNFQNILSYIASKNSLEIAALNFIKAIQSDLTTKQVIPMEIMEVEKTIRGMNEGLRKFLRLLGYFRGNSIQHQFIAEEKNMFRFFISQEIQWIEKYMREYRRVLDIWVSYHAKALSSHMEDIKDQNIQKYTHILEGHYLRLSNTLNIAKIVQMKL